MPNRKKEVVKNQQNNEISKDQEADFLESYVLFLANMNEFISAMKIQMDLTSDDIKKIFGSPYSNLKDTLYADTLIRQTLKSANDYLNELQDTLNKVKEAKKEVESLEERGITLDIPIPDFDFAERDLNDKILELQQIIRPVDDLEIRNVVNPLESLIEEQEDIDDEFAISCNEIMKKVSDMFNKAGLKVKKKRLGNAILNAMNVFRRTISIERKLRSGEELSPEESNEKEMPYMRRQCLIELLKAVEV